MSQPRIYVDKTNHDWFSDFIHILKENKKIKSLNVKIDHNLAFSILRANAKVNIEDPESIEVAIDAFLESINSE